MSGALCLALWLALPAAAVHVPQDPGELRVDGHQEPRAPVGMRARIADIVLPGTELRARPAEDLDAPIVIRVTAARVHGTAFRYDLEYYGLDPGRFDLADYLVRVDGSSTEGLPAITVEIVPQLPPGQVEPNELEPFAPPALGGYRTWGIIALIAWVLGLFAIVFVGRRRRRLEAANAEVAITLADRLRPIVEAAQRGALDQAGKAELERLLLAYWRRRLGLADEKIGHAIIELRGHDEAGPLLRQLEAWLHRPGPADDVDVARLLEPYRDTPADFDQAAPRAPAEVG